ncbi:MAG: dethiobiotin synthase [Acidimicrobiaceae bacterium]|nr:dethiobiotin synthase [Acidimicrobiaceae bacterium]
MAEDPAGPSAGIVVFVAGTSTEVGKTWAAAGLARLLRRSGLTVAACKPVQSYDPDESGPTDAAVLAEATGQHPDAVCPPERTYPVPLAPPMAAGRLGRACPSLDEMAAGCRFEATAQVGLVEGVGGLYSPIASDGHNLDLIERIEPDLVIVVASAALGGIHDTMACTLPLSAHRRTVFCNRFDPGTEVHVLNVRWLRDSGLEVATSLPELAGIVTGAGAPGHGDTAVGAD